MNLKEKIAQSAGLLLEDPKRFNHYPISLPELKQVNGEGGRFYVTPDGKRYPSVTTVLSSDPKKKEKIQQWRTRVGSEEANRVSATATRRGTKVHKLCEFYVNNELESNLDNTTPMDFDTFKKIKPFIDKYVDNVRLQEARLVSHFLEVAGTVDCVAEFGGKLSIIDFKTSRRYKKEDWIHDYFMQASSYAVMFEEMTGQPVTRLVIMIAVDNMDPQIFVKKRDDYIFDFIKLRKEYKERHNV